MLVKARLSVYIARGEIMSVREQREKRETVLREVRKAIEKDYVLELNETQYYNPSENLLIEVVAPPYKSGVDIEILGEKLSLASYALMLKNTLMGALKQHNPEIDLIVEIEKDVCECVCSSP